MNSYKALNKQTFTSGGYSLVPIRMEDRHEIMRWRNEQMYHLRQNKPLTKESQDNYFNTVVAGLFEQEKPGQIVFSYLKGETCIGYGGLVHINWHDGNAEISFIMDTALEKEFFEFHWKMYLELLEEVAFDELKFHKIYTYAYDIRPHLYSALKKNAYFEDAVLKDHCFFDGRYIDVRIHSKIKDSKQLRKAILADIETTFNWAINPKVRKYSYNRKRINWEEHKNWFTSKINNNNCYYYIFESDYKPLGSIRFDVDKDNNAMISYLIDPLSHGKGLGKDILKKGVGQLLKDNPQINSVYGYVMPENKASVRIFEKLGYRQSGTDVKQLKYIKEIP